MNKNLVRCFAVLLIPCLLADSVPAITSLQPSPFAAIQTSQNPFNSQALGAVELFQNNVLSWWPSLRPWRYAASVTAFPFLIDLLTPRAGAQNIVSEDTPFSDVWNAGFNWYLSSPNAPWILTGAGGFLLIWFWRMQKTVAPYQQEGKRSILFILGTLLAGWGLFRFAHDLVLWLKGDPTLISAAAHHAKMVAGMLLYSPAHPLSTTKSFRVAA